MLGVEIWGLALGVLTFIAPLVVSVARLYARVGQLEKESSASDTVTAQVARNSTTLTGLGVRVDHLERDSVKLDADLTAIKAELTSIKVALMGIETQLKALRKEL